jgi:adenine specific DNA methylase Mod
VSPRAPLKIAPPDQAPSPKIPHSSAEAVADGKAKPVGEVSEDDNLLIKGNNLLALHSLKARYAGKVKLIYIDPPYNTGGDGFRYNDRFNHSGGHPPPKRRKTWRCKWPSKWPIIC